MEPRKRSVRQARHLQQHQHHTKSSIYAKRLRNVCRHFAAFMFSNVGILGLVVGYTIAGAFIFREIEGRYHILVKMDVNKTRTETVARFWNLTLELNPFVESEYKAVMLAEMKTYQEHIVRSIQQGYDGSDMSDYSTKWSFAGAFLYSLTVITTIGYGNIAPHTTEGKLVTIVYAIIGMPLFLLYLSNIGDIMARSFKWVYANCCLCRWCPGVAKRRAERRSQRLEQQQFPEVQVRGSSAESTELAEEDEDEDEFSDDASLYDVQTVTVPLTICLAIMVGYICGGALLFCKWEDWEFLDASYFCFISLSTIGFGDLVPGDKIYGGGGEDLVTDVLELSFIFCSMYLMLGMALIAMCFNLMQEDVIHKIRSCVRTAKHISRCNRGR